ncbi:MAG: membrane protein insertase YidC [Flavobacteriales bacterium]|nr:membrane protein insertase YidC [Flavobacteriales bacterium]
MEQNKGIDKNQIAGILLIGAIMLGFGWWQTKNAPPVEPAMEATQDVEQGIEDELVTANQTVDVVTSVPDSFSPEEVTLSNAELSLTFSTAGATMTSAALADYHTYDDTAKIEALDLIKGNSQVFDVRLPGGEALSTKEFEVIGSSSRSLVLSDGNTRVTIELAEVGYDFTFIVNGTAESSGKPEIYWERSAQRTEKGITTERQYSSFVYQLNEDGDVEHLAGRGSDKSETTEPINWLAQKQRFFSLIIHPEQGFASADIATLNGDDENENLVKEFSATAQLNQTVSGAYSLPFTMYVGPNQYQLLKTYDEGYEKAINFGWGIFGAIGRGVVVPIFNWLEGYGFGYGLIILIMVLIIKLTLSPLTFASYRSMAKMRVLKPEIDIINEKFSSEKENVQKQQAIMSLYKEAGASPLGGCVPVIVQMPILFAMFRFFPASIELRGESFLWAKDLSTYDSIISWSTQIPLISTFFGNHLSLFTLLMTASTILYTWMNQQMTPQTGSSDQMKQLRVIMYLMPLMFMFVLNSFPSGLTYYYFLSNIITFAMQWGIRKTVNDEVILAKIDAKRAQPKKESKFQQRMAEMQRQQNKNRSQRRNK